MKIVVLILTFALQSLAQDPAGTPPPQVIFKKKETYKFSGLKLKGQLKKPELSYIYQRKGIRSEKIVDIPEDFNGEIREGSRKF